MLNFNIIYLIVICLTTYLLKSCLFEIELIQIDLFEIELFKFNSLPNRVFGKFDSIRENKLVILSKLYGQSCHLVKVVHVNLS